MITPHSGQEWKLRYSSPSPAPGVGRWYPCWAQLCNKILMMLGNLLMIWEKLINSRNGYSCGKDPKQKGISKSQKAIPLGSKWSGKCNPEQMQFDLNAAGTPPENAAAQHYVGQPVESFKTWIIVQPCPSCLWYPWCNPYSSRGLRDKDLFRVGASQALGIQCRSRLPTGEGLWGLSEASYWPHYSLVPQKEKLSVLVNTGVNVP